MPDISMCQNKKCSLSNTCLRFNSIPDKIAQSYSDFIYIIKFNKEDRKWETYCDSYIKES